MKWPHKVTDLYNLRVKTLFPLWPTLMPDKNWYWLERIKVLQKRVYVYGEGKAYWINLEIIEE